MNKRSRRKSGQLVFQMRESLTLMPYCPQGDVFTQAVVRTVGPLGQRCSEQRAVTLQGRQASCWDWFILSPAHEQLPQSQTNWSVGSYGDRAKKAMRDA